NKQARFYGIVAQQKRDWLNDDDKQTGTGANAATLVKENQFNWLMGKEYVATYKKETGFTSSFCNRCGSPVPNKINGTNYMWIPLGLLEQPFKPDLKLNFCIESKHDWVVLGDAHKNFAHLPELEEFLKYFE
ncbi:GFA family protein, partial [Acinetobacter baumannii]|nr:GFA family protein [Acinetobacter baumannii]